MRKLLLIAALALLSVALSATSTTNSLPAPDLGINTRVAILESRMDRLEASMDRLQNVESALARIEERLDNTREKSSGNANLFQLLGVALFSSIAGVGIGRALPGRDAGEK